ncbi:MAG: hypothetical protein RRB13_16105 [bacterium]|nr:hypothetical protein [bacterium]
MFRPSFWLLLGLACAPLASAWELSGLMEFSTRPPTGMVVYLPEDQGRQGEQLLDQKNKAFLPEFLLIPPGAQMKIKNSDEVDHNVYANDREAKVQFDIGLRPPGSTVSVPVDWNEGTLVKLSCSIHPNMRAWVLPVSSRYAQAFKIPSRARSFSFSLKNLPEKYSKIRLLVPGYSEIEASLPSAGELTIPLERKGRGKGTVYFRRGP